MKSQTLATGLATSSATDAPSSADEAAGQALEHFIARHPRLFIVTGAGCSTESGIPDYRDAAGEWKRRPPVMIRPFLDDELTRKRYWARGLAGWSHFRHARPNGAHHALALLERDQRIELLVTQNVDGLHQAAGSSAVLDLHGRADRIRCMGCEAIMSRDQLHAQLRALNPDWLRYEAEAAPDGDADLDQLDFAAFNIPSCRRCGAMLKTDVVFFGETVPAERVRQAMAALRRADAMLVVGSSLMVYSGYRFAQAAAEVGKPIAALNLGRTRADALLTLKIEDRCARALERAVRPNTRIDSVGGQDA
jgi:NAD-dependent SIR2 family protein deacetylase